MKVKVCQFDEQLGVLLPDELISSLGWERAAKWAMNNYRGVLEALAKE